MRARQHDQELLAAVARDHVDLAHALARDLGDERMMWSPQLARAGLVEGLELVDVDDRAGERVVVALGALELLGEARVEVAVVVEAGQLVVHAELLELLARAATWSCSLLMRSIASTRATSSRSSNGLQT